MEKYVSKRTFGKILWTYRFGVRDLTSLCN